MTGRHRLNPQLIKIHRSYSVDEVARVLRRHKNSIRSWLKQGLTPIDSKRPTLIHGPELKRFLEDRRRKGKQSCPPGYAYCVRCRVPKEPAGLMADYLPITSTSGNLRGICPDCGLLIHRRVALANLGIVQGNLDIAFPEGRERIRESATPSVNCDSKPEARADESE